MPAKVYTYENRRKIVVHQTIQPDGLPIAEVIVGLAQLHKGTPYGCLCWLANQGDRKAIEQLAMWRATQEKLSSPMMRAV